MNEHEPGQLERDLATQQRDRPEDQASTPVEFERAEDAWANADWTLVNWPDDERPDCPFAIAIARIVHNGRELVAMKMSDQSHEWFLRGGPDDHKLPRGLGATL